MQIVRKWTVEFAESARRDRFGALVVTFDKEASRRATKSSIDPIEVTLAKISEWSGRPRILLSGSSGRSQRHTSP